MFKALLLTKTESGAPHCAVTELDDAQLPAGEVLVQVSHSTLNYKDGLAITGQAPVVRTWPMVPGIDFAGTVLESSDARYRVGDGVVLNGWGVGEAHWGGLAQKARVKADWLVPLPAGMAPSQAMAIGTAGYTAMLCVMALQQHGVTPEQGPVLVTGGNGGVGSIAIALLSRLGFTVHASTGRLHEAEHFGGEADACNVEYLFKNVIAAIDRTEHGRRRHGDVVELYVRGIAAVHHMGPRHLHAIGLRIDEEERDAGAIIHIAARTGDDDQLFRHMAVKHEGFLAGDAEGCAVCFGAGCNP